MSLTNLAIIGTHCVGFLSGVKRKLGETLRRSNVPSSTMIQDEFGEDEGWGEIETPHAVPYAEYEWEKASGDQSADMNLRLYLPSSFLIRRMRLQFDPSRFDSWVDEDVRRVFFGPSLDFDGPSFALLDSVSFDSFLANHKLVLVWLIGGEKMVFDTRESMVKARMVFTSMLWTDGGGTIHNTHSHYMECAL